MAPASLILSILYILSNSVQSAPGTFSNPVLIVRPLAQGYNHP